MKRGGRKTLLTKPLQRKIERLLAQGRQTVAIGERTYYQWCARNRQFAQATTCAIGKSKITLVNKVRLAADWGGAAFLLERRFPDEFGRVEVREIPVVQDEKRINVAFVLPTGDQISMAKARAIAQLPPENHVAPTPEPKPEPEPTAGDLFDGDVSRLGRVEHDLPLDGNGG